MVCLVEEKTEDCFKKADDFGVSSLKISKQEAKRVFVGAGARALFYPTLLYNIVRNKLEAEFHWWDEIDQFLLLGAVPFPRDVPHLRSLGVKAVVTLNESYETLVHTSLYKNQGIKHLVIPTRDYLFAPSMGDLQCAVDFINENAQSGERTYVHCKAGRGRSTTVVLCYLIEHKGMTPRSAFEYVRSKRPRVQLAASQWQAVKEYSRLHNVDGQGVNQVFMSPRLLFDQQGIDKSASCSIATKGFDDSHDSISEEDNLVLINSTDLVGYNCIEDAGIIGNEFWTEMGVLYRLRLIAARNFVGVVRASASLAKVSFWLTTYPPGNKMLNSRQLAEGINSRQLVESLNGKFSSSCGRELCSSRLDVPVCRSSLVN